MFYDIYFYNRLAPCIDPLFSARCLYEIRIVLMVLCADLFVVVRSNNLFVKGNILIKRLLGYSCIKLVTKQNNIYFAEIK